MSAAQIRQPLPESLMKAIRAVIEFPYSTAQEKFEAVVLMTHGYGLWHAQTDIKPSAYAIPEEQWAAISEMLMAVPDGDIGKVNMALDWMNLGPSGYSHDLT
jgi:hypothetical protein